MKYTTFPIIFMGTDYISLQGLNQLIKHPNFTIKGVITQPPRLKGRGLHSTPSLVAHKAQSLSCPILTPDNLTSSKFLSEVKTIDAQWVIVLSYGKILPQNFLSLFPQRAVNFHASLLPRWRGAAPIQRAIMAGDKILGVSLQVIEQRLDTGPLIGTRQFKMETKWDATDIYNKMDFLISDLLRDLLKYMNNQLHPVPQNHNLATYAHKIDKQESYIVWNQPAVQIFNHIRGLVRGPQAYTIYNNKRLKIYKAEMDTEDTHYDVPPGKIVHINSEYFTVACKNSVLKITQVQPESKKIITAKEYITGYNLTLNHIFH